MRIKQLQEFVDRNLDESKGSWKLFYSESPRRKVEQIVENCTKEEAIAAIKDQSSYAKITKIERI